MNIEDEKRLPAQRQRICLNADVKENSSEEQRIYLNLIREFVRQLVVHYEYRVTVGGEHDGSDNRAGTEDSSVE